MSSTNLSAKVTVEELPPAPGAVEGVSTSTVATAGWTKRGRTDELIRAGSFAEFQLKTGSFWSNSFIAYALNGFFANDGRIALVRRVTPSDAVSSSVVISDAATAGRFLGKKLDATVAITPTVKTVKIQVNAFAGTEVDLYKQPAAQVWQVDATPGPAVFVDQTSNFNSTTAADWVVFPATEAVGDYCAIGFSEQFLGLSVTDVGGTVGVGGVVTWEYWNGSAWTSLPGLTDGTTGFTTTGAQTVTWTAPTGWAPLSLNGGTALYYVRARITTVFTTNPTYSSGTVDDVQGYTPAMLVARINQVLTTVDASLSSAASVVTDGQGDARVAVTSPTSGATSQVIIQAPAATSATLLVFGLQASSLPRTKTGLAASGNRFTFEALGGGAWGDDIRVNLAGNGNYLDANGGFTRFDLLFQEETDGDGNFSDRETFTEVVLDNDTSPAFMPDFVGTRSSLVSVEEGVGFGIPRDLSAKQETLEFVGDTLADGVITTFSGFLQYAPNRGTVTIAAGSVSATDDGQGALSGTGIVSGTVNYVTGEVAVVFSVAPAVGTALYAAYYHTDQDELVYDLTSGADGTGPLTRSLVTDPALQVSKGGIYKFDEVTDEVLNFILPDFAGSIPVANDLISYAETRKDIFVILDPPTSMSPEGVVQYVRDDAAFNTSYAAIYWPWLTVPDSLANGAPKNVPPSGHVAGVYARTDSQANVAQAPAGIQRGRLNNVIGYQTNPDESARDTVYPVRINPMIGEKQTGRAVWGARTLSLVRAWRYIQARRFFLFVEKSVFVNSWWSVFETIGPELFSRLQVSVRSFLRGLLAQGFFPTKKEQDAFAVIVDETNNSTTTADNGEVIIDVFLAPSKPGEFIRFRFRQKVATE